jgi:phytoene dehydrogenase-like protein
MTEKTIIIIGAGIAGLATGCYGQMNGYKTRIFELHDKPGGLCTAWKRKNYTFDGCIHWLVGSGKGSGTNRIWQELGAAQGRQFVDHEIYSQVVTPDGKTFKVYTNLDRLEQHMLELSPVDEKVIHQFISLARKFVHLDMPVDNSPGVGNLIMLLKSLPIFVSLQKWSRVTVGEFAGRFRDPFLKQAFLQVFGLAEMPVVSLGLMLASMHAKNAGYPIGASLAFSQSIAQRYLNLGGEIHYQSRVEKIIVENNRAVGIRLSDGSEHRADIIISAADGRTTIFDMLEGKYVNDTIRGYYKELPIFSPIVQVSMGVAGEFPKDSPLITYCLDKPVSIAGEDRHEISVRFFGYDPTLAPAGKSVIEVLMGSKYAYWKALAEDPEHYDAEKKQVGVTVINTLEKFYPGISGKIEVIDVTTPLTTEHYTGNWQGSMEGWMITTKTIGMLFGKGMDKTLPGLENFYMVGQWVEPGGGVPTGGISGRKMIQLLCKKDGKKFVTTIPA